MNSKTVALWRTLLYPTRLHILGMLIALLCCIPILFPEICPRGSVDIVTSYAGSILLISAAVSTGFMLISAVTHMLRLSNTRAFMQIFKWMGIWGTGFAIFILLALAADIPAPEAQGDSLPIQASDTLYQPTDHLNGPSSLLISINSDNQQTSTVANAPNLLLLEEKHEELLREYLDKSPRWSSKYNDDTFYSKPGHLVMVPPTTAGAPGLVHVCFRRIIEGDQLPNGYTLIQPGKEFPVQNDEQGSIPDFALDLGRNHFLLLAWRGSAHRTTALKAINAAITATDDRMLPLVDNPAQETVQQMLTGRTSYPGNTPEFRLSQPLAQEGAYQAEIYANPGEPGVILVYIKELATGKTLRLLNCPAQFSKDKNELFRHDIPGSMPHWIRSPDEDDISNCFPENTPLFAIRQGPLQQFFGVAFEVWFKPSDVRIQRRMLLRRCYKVQGYDIPAPETPPADVPQT